MASLCVISRNGSPWPANYRTNIDAVRESGQSSNYIVLLTTMWKSEVSIGVIMIAEVYNYYFRTVLTFSNFIQRLIGWMTALGHINYDMANEVGISLKATRSHRVFSCECTGFLF